MLKKISLGILFAACVFIVQANAQTTVSPEKQAALKELSALVSADNKAEDIAKMFAGEMEGMRKRVLKAIIDERTDLTAAERAELEKTFLSETGGASKNYTERLLQKIDYKSLVDEMFISTYDKVFTLEEIREMTAFYKTPTGQKMLQQSPAIMAESMKAMQEKLVPKMLDAVKSIEQEDRREIEEKINAKKPRAKTPDSK